MGGVVGDGDADLGGPDVDLLRRLRELVTQLLELRLKAALQLGLESAVFLDAKLVFFKVSRLSSIDACARFLIASIAALFWSALA